MNLEWRETGRLETIKENILNYFGKQIFVYPQYAKQIAGVRGGIVGTCQGLSNDSDGEISGSLECDGTRVNCQLSINLTGVTP